MNAFNQAQQLNPQGNRYYSNYISSYQHDLYQYPQPDMPLPLQMGRQPYGMMEQNQEQLEPPQENPPNQVAMQPQYSAPPRLLFKI